MSACNLRSLLLVAIVLSNCISWTASRHHFRHNVHGHRSRHRRQGTGLYLSSSYVLPGGEGEGWGEWGEVSPCSRTCGGGVAHQKRICLKIGSDGQPRCRGGDTKYFSCQTQDCPPDANDFRAEQCAEFNDKDFRGFRYNWIPYTKSVNPCELNCMPRAERFYYRHKPKVIDGTRCNEDSYDVCVNGVCQPVGCDMMLGSNAREDKCRECRGNGSNCVTTGGIIDRQDLIKGYNDLFLIPAGSTTIIIEEIAPSNNYLALRNNNMTYYLNGHYHIDFPKSMMIAGALWTYERSQAAFPSPDKLRCLGPTNEPLYLSLLLQEENVGIKFEYSVPKEMAPYTDRQYGWVHKEFSPCNASCGGGFQTRNVTCRSTNDLELVDDGLCDAGLKPATNQSCNTDPCPAEWVEGPWSECSKRCGKEGIKKREVTCQKIIVNGFSSIVAEKECFDLHGPKPELYQECNRDAVCPTWFVGLWKPCDKLCDDGKQTRQVVCHQKQSNGRIEIFDNSDCEGEMPKTEKPCMLSVCDGVDWVTTEWHGCDTCQSKVRTRTVLCATKDYQVYNDSFCEYHRRPVTEEACESVPPCDYQWYASQWSKCSVECGEGIKTRNIFCGLYDGTNVQQVEDEKCADQPKYNDTKPCKVPDEECPSQWYTTPWEKCSVECGGGTQNRRVRCMKGSTIVSDCSPDTLPPSTQYCNTQKCNEDELIPVDPQSGPIIDEYCDDENYEEVGLDSSDINPSVGVDVDSSYAEPADTESGFETTDETPGTDVYSTDTTIDYDYTEDDNDTSTTNTDTTEEDGESTATVISTSELSTGLSSSSETITASDGSSEFTTPESSTLSSESMSSASNILGPESTSPVSGSSESEFTSAEFSTSTSEPTSIGSSSSESSSSSSETSSSSSESSTSRSDSTSPESSMSTLGSSLPESSTPSSGSTSSESSTSESKSTTPESSTLSTLPGSSTMGSYSLSSESTSSESTSSESSTLNSESMSPESSILSSESTSSTLSKLSSELISSEMSTLSSLGSSTTGLESTSPEGSSLSSEFTSPETSITATESTSPESSTTGLESTSPEGSSSSSESLSPETSTSASQSTSPESSITGLESTSPEGTASSSESTSLETSTTGLQTTSPEGSLSSSGSTSPETSKSASESTLPESSTAGLVSVSPETSSTSSASESKSTDTSASVSGSTSPESSTTGLESTSPEGISSSSDSTSSETSLSSSESTSPEGSSSSSESLSPETSTSASQSTSPESSITGLESTSPEGTASSSESTSLETSTTGLQTTSPEGSLSSSGSTSPETSTSASESTLPESSTAGLVSVSPETSTTSSASESKSTDTSASVSGSTSPESSTTGLESKSPEGISSSSDSTSSETSLSSSESTSPEGSSSSSESLSPETSTSASQSTSPESSITGLESTSPEGTASSSKSTSLETSTTDLQTTSPEGSLSSSGSTSPETSTSASESTSPESSITGLESTSAEGTASSSESTSLETSTTDLQTTSPEGSLSSSGSTSPETSTSASESTLPESSTTGLKSTSPEVSSSSESTSTETSTLGSESTSLESSTPVLESTSLESSTMASEFTSPESSTIGSESTSEYSTLASETSSPEYSTTESESTSPGSEVTSLETSTSSISLETSESSTVSASEASTSSTELSETASTTGFEGTSTIGSLSTDSSTELSTEEGSTTPWSLTTVLSAVTKRVCKPRRKLKCNETKFGCCPDKKHAAAGPFDEGCPKPRTCKESEFGCCPDGVSPAGENGQGCPVIPCKETLFGCCAVDNQTTALGNDQEGCPAPCVIVNSKYRCCADKLTEATGENSKGCPEYVPTESTTEEAETTITQTEATDGSPSTVTSSDVTISSEATSSESTTSSEVSTSDETTSSDVTISSEATSSEGTTSSEVSTSNETTSSEVSTSSESTTLTEEVISTTMEAPLLEGCAASEFGCCLDNETPAHGPDFEGCCLLTAFGCCPDNRKAAEGSHLEGCECKYTQHGCCPDNVTAAQGPKNEGCGCQYTEFGCCPDRHTTSPGPNFEGCSCKTYQFGCCPDGVTVSTLPDQQSCRCQYSTHGCCGDELTPATGPNGAGCDCASSKYGCCPDGQTQATGPKFLGCEDIPEDKQAVCSLSSDSGPCQNFTVMWFFDLKYGGCSRFWYGGCEGNGNRFASQEACQEVCVHPDPKDSCKLPVVKGPCEYDYVRWYFNTTMEQCLPFRYGGCPGNANSFESRELCETRCQPDRTTDVCNLPYEQGPCAGNFRRWGYNSESGSCELFTWGGCEGNGNRFMTEAACQARCTTNNVVCSEQQDAGNCSDKMALWSFSQSENRCVPFYYTGCGGNNNRFDSRQSCEQICPSAYVPDKCTLPMASGECSDYREKWFFDTRIQRCRPFYYGGCGGNKNNFDSEIECSNACFEPITTTTIKPTQPQTHPEPNKDFCFMPIDVGGICPLAPVETKYAYDSALGKCVTFQYNGCGGNRNNFPSEEFCTYYCHPVQDICQLPMMSGPCDDSLMRWFYDPVTDSCSQFTYGGCQGNDNRFESRDACEVRCRTGSAPEPVTQRPTIPTTASTTVEMHSRFGETLPRQCIISTVLEECQSAGEVWYFNPRHHACLSHVNQESGRNCRHQATFSSQEACERGCGAFRGIDVCKQRLDPGTCQEFVTKVYFDLDSNTCKQFEYSGCLGGANRFSSIEECTQVCRPEPVPHDVCSLPPDDGNCDAYLEKWYYDTNRGDCYQFAYTGCGGNNNRFETRQECEAMCKQGVTTVAAVIPPVELEEECKTPSSLAPCNYNLTVYYYDSNSKSCLPSNFGNCGHPNSYRSEEECERRCGAFRGRDVCQEQLDPGPCRNNTMMKFYFDSAFGVCQPFTYGGCGGGANRFSTVIECEEFCRDSGPAPECVQEVNTGQAEGCAARAVPRYYFNAVHADCIVFTYEGCGGNENNFPTYELCRQICVPSAVNCESYKRQCASLTCEHIVRSSAPGGCESCACVDECQQYQEECDRLVCTYGVSKRQEGSCERCVCNENPCSVNNCTANERCRPVAYTDPATHDVIYTYRCEGPPSPPVPIPRPEPEKPVEAKEGGSVILRCLFHSNPPPKISWRKGEITIDGNVGRYRLTSEGALEIVSLYRNDTGVYICVADNEYGTATQQIHLVVKGPHDEVAPDCSPYEAECARLYCGYGTQYTRTADGCNRCHCNCEPLIQECSRLQCSYGMAKTLGADGCERCECHTDPCLVHNCTANERCVAIKQADPVTHKPRYSYICEGADCSAYEAECARLNCEYGTVRVRMADGCERCQCNCVPFREKCSRLRCSYGIERTFGTDGCERCQCKDFDPCAADPMTCLEGERCVAVPYVDPLTRESKLFAECRAVNKPGLCPTDDFFSNEVICEDECYDDAGCHGVGKCCMRGCKKTCVEPAVSTTATTILTTTHKPDQPAAPVSLPQSKPDVSWAEGDKATLRCLFHSNPPPRITWRRGELTINGNVGRYRLKSDGALEIVSLYRNDTGVYICVADNGLGTATQQIQLVVTDPEGTPVGIAGDENAVVTGELNQPLVVRCLAYGYPVPDVFWLRGNVMVPYNDGVYEIRGHSLHIRSLTIETLGQYTCQAYNGVGKPASWVVLVRAYRPDGFFLEHEHLVARQNIFTTRYTPPPTTVKTTTPTTTTTERRVFFTVPVNVHVSTTYSTLNIGTDLRLACEVDGYPEAAVYWTKDGQRIVPDDRTSIAGTTISRLEISRVAVSDSGQYGCHADNGYSSHSDTAQVNVQQLTVPAKCTDNPFFAKCELIVRNKFCDHKYYSKFCCKSCVEAGQLDPQVAEAQADQSYRKK